MEEARACAPRAGPLVAGALPLTHGARLAPCPAPAHPRRRTLPDEPPHAPPPVQPRLPTLATWPAPAALWKLTAGWWLHRDRALVISPKARESLTFDSTQSHHSEQFLISEGLDKSPPFFFEFSRQGFSKIFISLCLPNAGNILTPTTTTTPSPKQPLFKLGVWLTRL